MPLTKSEAEARCGFSIPPEIWAFEPWGNRVLIRREPPERSFGTILIPDTAQRQVSAGTIIKVGSGVGSLNGLPGQCLVPDRFLYQDQDGGLHDFADPDLLVGLVVTIGHWTGEAIRPSAKHSVTGDTYDTEYLLCQAVDIWGHNDPMPPPAAVPQGDTP